MYDLYFFFTSSSNLRNEELQVNEENKKKRPKDTEWMYEKNKKNQNDERKETLHIVLD